MRRGKRFLRRFFWNSGSNEWVCSKTWQLANPDLLAISDPESQDFNSYPAFEDGDFIVIEQAGHINVVARRSGELDRLDNYRVSESTGSVEKISGVNLGSNQLMSMELVKTSGGNDALAVLDSSGVIHYLDPVRLTVVEVAPNIYSTTVDIRGGRLGSFHLVAGPFRAGGRDANYMVLPVSHSDSVDSPVMRLVWIDLENFQEDASRTLIVEMSGLRGIEILPSANGVLDLYINKDVGMTNSLWVRGRISGVTGLPREIN
jgi:hypothetical protein